ncbi:RseA family anti-sigma factor [Luteimonas vadosa]|uniref:Sigma-E factor negative regulatory protein n=1 Tax=Luteimonas vadosa TaxID=1165507 RepID=A0ABP9DX70_9GAMM
MTTADDMADDIELVPPDRLALHHRQQLSAMLDGELSPDRAKFMLRRLQHDEELAACWERWQVCGDMLRGRGHALLPPDFAQRVARAIAHGGVGAEAPTAAAGRESRLARWGGSAALAASVAVVAFFVARQLPADVAPATDGMPAGLAAEPAGSPPGLPVAETGQPGAPDLGAAAVAGAFAVAEVPRRAVQRSRGQGQRAATRQRQQNAQAPMVAVASQRQAPSTNGANAPSPDAAEAVPAFTHQGDPFAASVATSPRPWPRAILPGLAPVGGGFMVSANPGAQPTMVDTAFAGFEPRLQQVERAERPQDPSDALATEGPGTVPPKDAP